MPPLLTTLTHTLIALTLILIIIALLLPYLTSHPTEHYTESACYSLNNNKSNYKCTMDERARVALKWNAHNDRDTKVKIKLSIPPQCVRHQHILNKHSDKQLRGFSAKTKTDIAHIHSKMGQTRVRHCQLGDRLKANTYGHDAAMHNLKNAKVLSKTLFQPVTSSAAYTDKGTEKISTDKKMRHHLQNAFR